MPGLKSKVPEYPRPVSPVSAEEYPIGKDTTVYFGGNDVVEESAKLRATKRRRIESCATAYLRGEPLFILSAQLKGPFGNDWQNPWGKARRVVGRHEAALLEVPETTAKHQLEPTTVSAKGVSRLFSPTAQTHEFKSSLQRAQADEISLSSAIDPPPVSLEPTDNIFALHLADAGLKNQKVEDWLKKHKSYSQAEEEQPHSSPTPLQKPTTARTKKWECPIIDVDIPPVPDRVVELANLLLPQKFDMSEEEQPSHHSKNVVHHINTKDQSLEVNSAGAPSTNKSRAEHAILKSKRRSLHTIPPSSYLPAFEYRKVFPDESKAPAAEHMNATTTTETHVEQTKETLEAKAPLQSDASETSRSLHTAQDAAFDIPSISHLSKERSKASTEREMPSAQIPVQAILQSAPSNLSSNVHLLEEPLDQPAQIFVPMVKDDNGATSEDASRTHQVAVDERLVQGVANETINVECLSALRLLHSEATPRNDAARPVNTQQMIETITPFAFTTAKKKAIDVENKSTPVTATKSRLIKNRKRASFVTEEASSGSSQGSLKTIMKVAKPSMVNQGKTNSPKGIWEMDDEDENSIHHIQMSTSATPNAVANAKRTAPRSILKSSFTASTDLHAPSTNNASSSMKQDAQRVKGFDMVDAESEHNEDDFDVDAAIDDLGGFLGTWDADKEAMELGKTLA